MYRVYKRLTERSWQYQNRDPKNNSPVGRKEDNPVIPIDLVLGTRVSIHRNLNEHKGLIWSIKNSDKEKYLISYSYLEDTLVLDNVDFEIDRSGQRSAFKGKSRNPHAYVTGDIVSILEDQSPPESDLSEISYTPPFIEGWDGREFFVVDSNTNNPDTISEVKGSKKVYLYKGKVFAKISDVIYLPKEESKSLWYND
jgi:hypothetical protein